MGMSQLSWTSPLMLLQQDLLLIIEKESQVDISKTYTKMCDKSTEIQILKPHYLEGEFVSNREDFEVQQAGDWLPNSDEQYIWLPRQDQLQEMIRQSFETELERECLNVWYNVNQRFFSFWRDSPTLEQLHGTMEQLWLAFVMKEKYNKVWNGKDWI
jgi:hypothetical protein